MPNCLDIIDVQRPLHQHPAPELMVFEDVLHLANCVRYRFVCGSRRCPYPHENVTVSVQDFETNWSFSLGFGQFSGSEDG